MLGILMSDVGSSEWRNLRQVIVCKAMDGQAVGNEVVNGQLALFCGTRLDNAGGHSRCISDNAYKRLVGGCLC